MSEFKTQPMNVFRRVFGVSQGSFRLGDMLDLSPLEKQQIGYVVKVLNICFFWCCFILLGVWVDQIYDIEKMPSLFAGSMALICIYRSPSTPHVWVGKLGLIIVAGFCEGLLAGGIVYNLIGRDHQFVMVCIVGVMGIVLIFSVAVQLQKQRVAFYAGGMIASFGLLGYLNKNIEIFKLEQQVMIGLLCFGGYLCFCCQIWLSLLKNGDDDFVSHAFYLPLEPLFIILRMFAVTAFPQIYKQQQQQFSGKQKVQQQNKQKTRSKKHQ